MNARTLYQKLQEHDINLAVTNGKLSYQADMGKLTQELIAAIQQHKNTLIGLVERRNFHQRVQQELAERQPMEDTKRTYACAIRNQISAFRETTYRVEQGKLLISSPDGLTPEQRALIKEHRETLVWLLSNPPASTGTCFHGHPIRWTLQPCGTWLCACYGGQEAYEQWTPSTRPSLSPAPAPAGREPRTEPALPAVRPIKRTGNNGRVHAVLGESDGQYFLYAGESYSPIDLPANIDGFLPLFETNKIDVLWVMPDCSFSSKIEWAYVGAYDHEACRVFPDSAMEGTREKKPSYISMRRERRESGTYQQEFFLAFPEHEKWVGDGTWNCPDVETLYQTVTYIESKYPNFGWSPQAMGRQLLRGIHQEKGWSIPDSALTDELKNALDQSVQRPTWIQDTGLSDEQKTMQWIVGGDKNAQYLGGTRGLSLSSGDYVRVDGSKFDRNVVGLWHAEVTSVEGTIFDSYQAFCPWTSETAWLSTDLLLGCEAAGIQFKIHEGLIWQESGKFMDEWGKLVWQHRAAYQNTEKFSCEVARRNASGTAKQVGNSFIGLLAHVLKAKGRGMIYRPEWNVLIIHKAIANLMYSIKSRYEKHRMLPVLLAGGDTQWFAASEPTIPGFFDHTKEQKGWKPIGQPVPMSEEIITLFESQDAIATGNRLKELATEGEN